MKGKASIYFSALIAFLMLIMMLILMFPMPSAFSWSYGDPAKPPGFTYEKFGPRADRLLIQMYPSQTAELEAGLEVGDLDVTDWPLDGTYYDRYTTDPWDDSISVLGYGPEFGLYLFDLNNNNNPYLGNPQNPAYPNPVYPNPMSDVDLRKAVAYLTGRAAYIAFVGPTTSSAVYTPVGPSAGKYASPTIYPGGADELLCYLYNPATANATLNAGGFPVGPSGWRYWDMNGNGIEDAGEAYLNLKIISRSDDPARAFAGSDISTQLTMAGVSNTISYVSGSAARTQVMANKDFHIYTGYWNLGVDPDFLILWNWDYYWHPGVSYNYDGCNDTTFNTDSDGVQCANDQAQAVSNAHAAQVTFATNVLSVPLWCTTGFKAVSRTYSGSETPYSGEYWEGFVNVPGYGADSGYSFLNMHTTNYQYGNFPANNMTIRYGFKVQGVNQFNPIYADSFWDNTVIDLIGYDSLLGRNPYNLGEFMPMVALQYSAGTYLHPTYGTCSKVVFTLRPGMEWQDGTPVTIADIYFTFVEIDGILESRGFAPPWWISNVQNILSFSILDPYNFEVLLNVKSVFASGWIGGNRILPKHIWKPICTTGDPSTDEPDPNMIGSGAWRMNEYIPDQAILLTANAPNKAVRSPLLGSTTVTSKMGYYRYTPIIAYANATRTYSNKFNMSTSINMIDVHYVNEKAEAVVCTLTMTVTHPNGMVTTATQTNTNIPALSDLVIRNPWPIVPLQAYGLWKVTINATFPDRPGSYGAVSYFWVTLREDITGKTWYENAGYTTYPYKSELVSGDFKVDTKDVASAAKAFGTYPGDSRWNTGADIIKDYKIDVKDIAGIAKKFGWVGV